jgi:hypothetical protein
MVNVKSVLPRSTVGNPEVVLLEAKVMHISLADKPDLNAFERMSPFSCGNFSATLVCRVI